MLSEMRKYDKKLDFLTIKHVLGNICYFFFYICGQLALVLSIELSLF